MTIPLPVIIGIGGAARSGKNEVAKVLERLFGFTVLGFSDPLRDALLALNPLIPLEFPVTLPDGASISGHTVRYSSLVGLAGYTEAKRVPEVRQLLQRLGTDVVRQQIGEDAWVDIARRRITEALDGQVAANLPPRVVVEGIRFPNELEMIRALGGRTLYIHRPDIESLGHVSEHSLSPLDFDLTLMNDGTLDALGGKTHEVMGKLFESSISKLHSTLDPSGAGRFESMMIGEQ